MTRRQKKKLLIICLVMLVGIGTNWLREQPAVQKVLSNQTPPGYYHVVEVFDGDTFAVNMDGVVEKVRLIGIDTPETHHPEKPVQCFGMKAHEYLSGLLGTQPVRLENDPTNTNRDRYDRLLRYAYLQDGTLVNAKIIEEGYGFAYVLFPFEKLEEFRTLQATAQSQDKGLWSSCDITDQNNLLQTEDAS